MTPTIRNTSRVVFTVLVVASVAAVPASASTGATGPAAGSAVAQMDGTSANATVTFDDQTTDGSAVTVASTTLHEGGYVVVHESNDGAPGAVVGNSTYLEAGSHEPVEITLDPPVEANATLIAMAHRETNGNETYEFPDADGPYTANGSAAVDPGEVTVSTDTSMGTEMATETPTAEDSGSSGSGPGFGIVAALAALAAATLVAARRR